MACWKPEDGIEAQSPFLKAVYALINGELRKSEDQGVRLVSIDTAFERNLDCSECIFTFELPLGLVMKIEYCAATAQEIFYDLVVTDVEWASDFVIDVLRTLRFDGCGKLTDAVHKQRTSVRKTFADWLSKHGISANLLETKLRWTEWERYTGARPHIVAVSSLDSDLQPACLDLELDLSFDPSTELDKLFSELSERHSAASYLTSRGANGSIDMLALRALEASGSVEAGLRNWACLAHGSDIYEGYERNLGHIWIDKTVFSKRETRFRHNSVTVYGMRLPESVLMNLVGKPVTDLLEHEYLSSEMIITCAENAEVSDDFFTIVFSQPVYYFCSLSGRFWR